IPHQPQLILPAKLARQAIATPGTQAPAIFHAHTEALQTRRELVDGAAWNEQAVLLVTDNIGDAPRTVGDVRHSVGPGLQEYQTEEHRLNWQPQIIKGGKEPPFFFAGETPQPPAGAPGRKGPREILQKSPKIAHPRPGQSAARGPLATPQRQRCFQQV